MLTFSTDASTREVTALVPEALFVEHDKGMTVFRVRERDAECAVYELSRAGFRVHAGTPRVSYSSPRAFATASAHIRRR